MTPPQTFRSIWILCLLLGLGCWQMWKIRPSGQDEQRQLSSASNLPQQVRPESAAVSQPPAKVMKSMSGDSSLASALDSVRRAVQSLSPAESGLPQNAGVSFFAAHPGQQLTARFRKGDMVLASGRADSSWSVALRWLNPASTESEALPARTAQSRVEYSHAGGVVEWYENRPEGLEHGFIVQRGSHLAEADGSRLRLSLAVSGLQSRSAEDAVDFVDPASQRPVFRYGKLKVWDSQGRVLDSTLETTDAGVDITIAAAGAVYPLTVDPLITSLEAVLTPEFTGDGAPQDRLAQSMALVGDSALIGVPNDDTAGGIDAGSVYVFTRTAGLWTQQTRLTASDGAANDLFGFSVAMSGSSVLVGAYSDDRPSLANSGSAYIFTQNAGVWSQEAKIEPVDSLQGDGFGYSVGLSGDTALIGAPFDEPTTTLSNNHGSAYIFTRSAGVWSLQQKLVAGDAAIGDNYGFSVSLEADSALVGAPRANVSSVSDSGAAYVHVRSGSSWTQQRKLSPAPASDASASDQFGQSVALSGETALIGAFQDDHTLPQVASNGGSAYVFLRSGTTWSQQAKLVAADTGNDNRLGSSVALDGDIAVLGAPDPILNAPGPGSAYVFARTGALWTQQQKIQATDGATGQRLGSAVAVSGSTLLASAPYQRSEAGEEAGSAYVYVLDAGAWGFQQKLTAGDGASRDVFGLSLAASGSSVLVGAPYDDSASGIDVGSAYVFNRNGSAWQIQGRLTSATAAANDYFGTSVAMDGDYAVVGAPQIDPEQEVDSLRGPGKAFAFQRTGTVWSTSQSLVPSEAQANDDFFGLSVAVSSGTAVVGAPRHDPLARVNAGAAYVFLESGGSWTQQAKLLPSDSTTADQFGFAVGLSGQTAIVGAPLDNSPAADAGSAYVFVRAAAVWTQQQKLTAIGAASLDDFGRSVSISGDTALVGAPLDDVGVVLDTGSAYVFQRTGLVWAQQAQLNAASPLEADLFGRSVAILGDTALVGEPADDLGAENAGSATVFIRTGTAWSREALLSSSEAAGFDVFGTSVALSSSFAAVGVARDDSFSPVTNDPRLDHGSVQIFRLGLSPLEAWRTTHFGSPDNSGDGADGFDFDHDGLANLLEWAGNLNPTLSSTFTASASRDGGELVFLYSRSTSAQQAGAVFIVEWSDTLADLGWSTQGVIQTQLTDNGTLQSVRATMPAGELGRRFIRLRVQAP
jgi:hypothetical protein